jgi:DNA-binding NtrC family response regulator
MNTHDETILIVDDEKLVRRLLVSTLSGAGYTCLEAGNAGDALAQLKNRGVSVVLLDIVMPDKSGIELLNEVMVAYPDIAPIMLSAVSNSDIAITCMKQGAYDYILKPFNTKEVSLRIEYANMSPPGYHPDNQSNNNEAANDAHNDPWIYSSRWRNRN